jgi:pantothenate synthetase
MQIIEQNRRHRRLERGRAGANPRRSFVLCRPWVRCTKVNLCLVRAANDSQASAWWCRCSSTSMQVGPSEREDFANIPARPAARPLRWLVSLASDVVVSPEPWRDIIPTAIQTQTHIEGENLSLPLCGPVPPRPFFRGVATSGRQAVLFIVRPHVALFRRKRRSSKLPVDAPSGAPISAWTLEIVGQSDSVRESPTACLEMSSRNAYLTLPRNGAPQSVLSRALC